MNFPAKNIFESYENHREKSFTSSKFKHLEIKNLITKISASNKFQLELAGKSFRGKEIFLIKFGRGKKNILLWSQMHGDEPTATMAIFDLLNFLSASDEFDPLRKKIDEELSLYFLPLLNPDGAEMGTRRNALGIDLNRDAKALASPESRILMSLVESLKPQFAFNLHDQDIRFSVGETKEPAVISLLAPPYNYAKDKEGSRKNAMLLTAELFKLLGDFAPGRIARYSDDHEPRSFGDSIQGKGTATILIESGRNPWLNDKSFSRQLNFLALLDAFYSIATGEYLKEKIRDYETIPFNGKEYFDLIIRNVRHPNHNAVFDIAIDREEFTVDGDLFYYKGIVKDIGDLRNRWGTIEIDENGLAIFPGEIYEKTFHFPEQITKNDALSALENGALFIKTKNVSGLPFIDLPVNVVAENSKSHKNTFLKVDEPANFLLKKNGVTKYFVVNGFIISSLEESSKISNGLIWKC